MTKAKTSKEKNTSDFVTCWLPIIFLGIGSILISIRNFSFLLLHHTIYGCLDFYIKKKQQENNIFNLFNSFINHLQHCFL